MTGGFPSPLGSEGPLSSTLSCSLLTLFLPGGSTADLWGQERLFAEHARDKEWEYCRAKTAASLGSQQREVTEWLGHHPGQHHGLIDSGYTDGGRSQGRQSSPGAGRLGEEITGRTELWGNVLFLKLEGSFVDFLFSFCLLFIINFIFLKSFRFKRKTKQQPREVPYTPSLTTGKCLLLLTSCISVICMLQLMSPY